MPNTYSQIYIHLVFAVKGRQNFIKESFREELQKYMTGIINHNKQKLYAIFCMPDHTHIFISINPDCNISNLVRDIKANSSTFIKNKKWTNNQFSWQTGFGAFSNSKSQTKEVVNYILNQPKGHKKTSFREEYIDFLNKFEVEYDEKYLFEFYD